MHDPACVSICTRSQKARDGLPERAEEIAVCPKRSLHLSSNQAARSTARTLVSGSMPVGARFTCLGRSRECVQSVAVAAAAAAADAASAGAGVGVDGALLLSLFVVAVVVVVVVDGCCDV